MSSDIEPLARAASQAASQGRWADAERLWSEVRARDPRHPQALYSLGVHAFQRGDLAAAQALLQQAHEANPREPLVLLSLAVVHRERRNAAGELAAIDAALTIDPYFLGALVAKAAHVERHGGARPAAPLWRNALKVAPPEHAWPPALRDQLVHGKRLVERHGEELAAFLAARMGTSLARLAPTEAERWQEAGAILAGRTSSYPSVPNRLLVPRLPAIPFFDRAQFDWVNELEASTAAIIAEFQTMRAAQDAEFRPYVQYAPGTPVNQWAELNHSRRWSSYFLWRNGQPVLDHQAHCPVTTAALKRVGMADIDGLCPNAMFSALAPRTAIPPHHGETNARLVVHLPLIVPDNCTYRVGFERRRWKVGEVLIFDDSIEHEARNDSDELRVVLIFDVWNPLLSAGERDMVRLVTEATRDFHAQV